MDGIDGIASIEVISVCFSGVLLYMLGSVDKSEWAILLLLLSVMAGFILWNFPKAHIFLGDVGSGFLGIVIGILSVRAAWIAPELFWSWAILLGAFIVDATITLVRRVVHGEKYYEAHRNHAYQFAARKYGAHSPVSLVFGAINLFWLLPIAALVAVRMLDGILGVIVAYIPLAWLAVHFKAGASEVHKT